MKTLCVILDHLAEKDSPQAADVAAQRLKALEKSLVDGGRWDRAQFLELIDTDHVSMLTDAEEKKADKDFKSKKDFSAAWTAPPSSAYEEETWPKENLYQGEQEEPAVLLKPSQWWTSEKGSKKPKGKGKGKGKCWQGVWNKKGM